MKLSEVLAQHETITNLANGLGFINLRLISNNESMDCFNLLVSVDKNNPNARSTYASALAAELMNTFNIEVRVYVETTLKPLYKESILAQAAVLTDTQKLISLFQQPLNNIILKQPTLTKEELSNGLELAKLFKNNAFSSQFFQKPKEEVSSANLDTSGILNYKAVLNTITEDKQIGEQIFSRLDADTLNKINSAYHEVLAARSPSNKI